MIICKISVGPGKKPGSFYFLKFSHITDVSKIDTSIN